MINDSAAQHNKAPVPDEAACGYYLRIHAERTAPEQMIKDIAILQSMISAHRDWLPEPIHLGMIFHCSDLLLRLAAHRPPDEPAFMEKYAVFEKMLSFNGDTSNLRAMVKAALATDIGAIAPHLTGKPT